MFTIAGQKVGPNGLTFFKGTYAKKNFFLKNLVFSFFISCFFKSTENAGHFTGADTGFKPGGARFFRYKIV